MSSQQINWKSEVIIQFFFLNFIQICRNQLNFLISVIKEMLQVNICLDNS